MLTQGKRVALDAFAANLPTDRSTHQRSNGLWFVDEASLPTFSVEEVKSGFAANENLVIRGEKIDEKGHKIVLSREASYLRKSTTLLAWLRGRISFTTNMETVFLLTSFSFITGFHGFHVFSGV